MGKHRATAGATYGRNGSFFSNKNEPADIWENTERRRAPHMGETALFSQTRIDPLTYGKTQGDDGRHIWEKRLYFLKQELIR